MKRFKQYLESIDKDDYDSWWDYLYEEGSGITKESIKELLSLYDFEYINYDGFVKFWDNSNNIAWLEHDKENDTFSFFANDDDDMRDTVINMTDYDKLDYLNIEEGDVWIGGWETSINNMQKNPQTVYHYTTEDALEDIKESGHLRGSYGTGLSNRSAYGIFTTLDIEEHAIGTYGDVQLSLDLASFMKDSDLDKLDLYPEPDVMENALTGALLHKLDIEDAHDGVPSDMSELTVIVGHNIPMKYIRIED